MVPPATRTAPKPAMYRRRAVREGLCCSSSSGVMSLFLLRNCSLVVPSSNESMSAISPLHVARDFPVKRSITSTSFVQRPLGLLTLPPLLGLLAGCKWSTGSGTATPSSAEQCAAASRCRAASLV